MDEVASVAILAMTFLDECIAGFSLVGIVRIEIDSQLVSTMGELTLRTVWTEPFFSVILAQTALNL